MSSDAEETDAENGGGTAPPRPESSDGPPGSAVEEKKTRCAAARESLVNFLRSISPSSRPIPWLLVNCATFVASAVLLTLVFLRPYIREQYLVRKLYLIYNLLTTVAWLLEVELPTLEHERPLWHASWKYIVESALAWYFTLDSIGMVIEWKLKRVEMDGMIVDLIINMAAYAYAVREVWKMHRRRRGGFLDLQQEAEAPLV